MEVGIIGLARSGKTTVFNAVTHGTAATGTYSGSTAPNFGTVNVPDPRVDGLAELYKPKKIAYAAIQYVDFPAAGESFGKGDGPAGKFINDLGRLDSLIHVVRAFNDDTVPHPDSTVDPARDIEAMDLELSFADIAMIERRLERMDREGKSAKPAEREQLARTRTVLERIKGELESEVPLRAQHLSDDDRLALAGTQFLTAKPLLVVLNAGEEDLDTREALEAEYRERYEGAGRDVAVVGGKFEMELNELDAEEAEEFRASAGVTESGMDIAIRRSYGLLGLISFLTAGEDECRAWTVRNGAKAPEAAGRIHSDLERGFIRAEVVSFNDLMEAGSESEAKKRGTVRTEGKEYLVQDGDVLHILFNV